MNAWSGGTLESNKGSYVASMFDVAHDNGLRTSMWAGKSKFGLLTNSYDTDSGALDVTGVNNGRNKIDTNYVADGVSANVLTTAFIGAMTPAPFNLSFLHYQDPDAAGHSSGWGSTGYNTTLEAVDTELGRILALIAGDSTLKGNTAIILTADHGGTGTSHGNMANASDYTVPFFSWGAGVGAGDLYWMNPLARLSPEGNPSFTAPIQPIRNGDLGNLALDLLGLGPIPGSTINSTQNLLTATPEFAGLAPGIGLLLSAGLMRRQRRRVLPLPPTGSNCTSSSRHEPSPLNG